MAATPRPSPEPEPLPDPSQAYASPEELADDEELTLEERAALLERWEADDIALQRADPERGPRFAGFCEGEVGEHVHFSRFLLRVENPDG